MSAKKRNKGFLYELHAHTSETSPCGRLPAAQLVERYKKAGYAGIFTTDHMFRGFAAMQDCERDWHACVDAFWEGYRAAKKHGDAYGLDVLPAMELTFEENPNDYLIIGMDEEMLYQMPFPYQLGLEAFRQEYGSELLIIQAHPFRGGRDHVRPELLDGVEGVNCNPRHDNHNEKAMRLWRENPHLLCTCGSDAHQSEDVAGAGVLFSQRPQDAADARRLLLEGDYRLRCAAFQQMLPGGALSKARP